MREPTGGNTKSSSATNKKNGRAKDGLRNRPTLNKSAGSGHGVVARPHPVTNRRAFPGNARGYAAESGCVHPSNGVRPWECRRGLPHDNVPLPLGEPPVYAPPA